MGKKNPTYRNITDSTESVLIEYDPSSVTYTDLIKLWADSHAPYYPSKCQYRSAIFYLNDEQKDIATKIVRGIEEKKNVKVYTDIEPVSPFYRAEEYHQDFLDNKSWAFMIGLLMYMCFTY